MSKTKQSKGQKAKMSTSTFFKHLSYTLIASRIRCFHKLTAQSIVQPITPFSFGRFFITTHEAIVPGKPNHTLVSANVSSLTSKAQSSYLSVNILCPKDFVDMLSEALLCFGASSTTVDENDEKSNEICINTIFPEGYDVSLCISKAVDSIGLKDVPSYEVGVGEQCDWISKSQESFNPVEVTQGLWIVPEWRDPPDDQATNVILNPGLAFGTGEHPTTKLCLLLLHGLIKGGELFLDYGTGSGVLAIAALKLGCCLSVGVDIDPQAITSARQNAALNNIGPEKLQLHIITEKPSSTVTSTPGVAEEQSSTEVEANLATEKYDVVVANILLNPLLDLAENIVSHAKPGAVVGLSGILTEQVPSIMERYSVFLDDISVTEMDDWACIRGRKKRNHASN